MITNAAPAGRGFPIEIDPRGESTLVDVVANGRPLKFMLDTGASTCWISTRAAKLLGLHSTEGGTKRRKGSNAYMSSLASLRVAGKSLAAVRVEVGGFVDQMDRDLRDKVDGIVGYNFWSRFRMTVDYPHLRLLLEDSNRPEN